jgi:hypothetical protein
MSDNREHYIPLRRADIVERLCRDAWLHPNDAAQMRRWCELASAFLHFRYQRFHDGLKDAYAPYDPEATTVVLLTPPTVDERAAKLDEFFTRIDRLMTRANFITLDQSAIDDASRHNGTAGINLKTDFSLFERFRLYARGESTETITRRPWYRFWRRETITVPLYRRLVVAVKVKPGPRLPKRIDPDRVFLKYFKDIPKADLDLLLPGARVVMPAVHRLKLGGSIVSGLCLLLLNIIKPFVTTAILGVQYMYGLVFGLLGYGWRQYAGYQTTRAALSLRLTENLYYQNLANNAGVLFTLLDEAEEQDTRELILAYFHLWRLAGSAGWTMGELDESVERQLHEWIGTPVDFEVDDALAKLMRLGLAVRRGERFIAVPIEKALIHLDRMWDNAFPYNNRAAA